MPGSPVQCATECSWEGTAKTSGTGSVVAVRFAYAGVGLIVGAALAIAAAGAVRYTCWTKR